MRNLLAVILLSLLVSCQEIIDAPVPSLAWAEFDAPDAKPLSAAERKALEGVYITGESADDFGKEAALKWSYKISGGDTTHYLSFFCAEDVRYFICQAKKKGDSILLNGYWRNIENTKTGKAHFTISMADVRNDGAAAASQQRLSLGIAGVYGLFDDEPEKKISFRYNRPLHLDTAYTIVAHRGGGRNNDLLPASENSVEMIPLASQLGATGIEIDVQFTKDGVPVLFHDANVNDRLTTKTGIHGAIDSYTWAELDKEVKLKRGGKIPTLEAALDTVLRNTPLELVWLDCKYADRLGKVLELEKQFTKKAEERGRTLKIFIGLPDEEVLNKFASFADHKNISSLCELDTAKAFAVNASIWAPSWTKGHQDENVAAVHRRGLRSFVWTVDVPDKIKEFMYEARFNGLVTNRPTMAAYYLFAKQ